MFLWNISCSNRYFRLASNKALFLTQRATYLGLLLCLHSSTTTFSHISRTKTFLVLLYFGRDVFFLFFLPAKLWKQHSTPRELGKPFHLLQPVDRHLSTSNLATRLVQVHQPSTSFSNSYTIFASGHRILPSSRYTTSPTTWQQVKLSRENCRGANFPGNTLQGILSR
jgi:hypothetical protein